MFKSLLMIFTYITTIANIGCAVEKRQIRLTTASRCIPTTKKMHRSPERPLSTSCLIWFAHAANVSFPPILTLCRERPEAAVYVCLRMLRRGIPVRTFVHCAALPIKETSPFKQGSSRPFSSSKTRRDPCFCA
jgi:hypothetical protein